MRVRERLEVLGVLVAELGLDVVPEDGEPLAAETLDLLHLVQQQRDLLLVAVPDVQARGDPVEEDDVVLLAALDQLLDVPTLLLGVQLPPLGPVLRVVLGRVEIRVQLVLVHLPEEVEPLRHGPGPVVEPLDDPREESGLGTPGTRASIGHGHSAAHVTLLSSSLLEQIFVYSTTENALKPTITLLRVFSKPFYFSKHYFLKSKTPNRRESACSLENRAYFFFSTTFMNHQERANL